MESLDFLYTLKDVEGFDGRPVPPPRPPSCWLSRWRLSVILALVLLGIALGSIEEDIRRHHATRAQITAER